MAWILGVLLLGGLYSSAFCLVSADYRELLPYLLILLLAVFISEIVLLIRCGVSAGKTEKDRNRMRRAMLFVKLAAIPLFVINFAAWVLLAAGFTLLPKGFGMWFTPIPWVIALVIVAATYLVMLATSLFALSAIALYYKAGMLKKWELALHITLQLIFVADVADAVYLFVVLRRREKAARQTPLEGSPQFTVPLQSAPLG